MFRATVNATESTDLPVAVSELRAKCMRGGLDASSTEQVVDQVTDVLAQLLERGKQLASLGSQMRVVREITADDYSVKLVFQTGGRRTFLQRIRSSLFGG